MKKRAVSLIAVIVVATFMISSFAPPFSAAAAGAEENEIVQKIEQALSEEDSSIAEEYPNGMFEFSTVINEVEESSSEPLKLYVVRHGGTEGDAVVNLKFADYSAEYGKDYYAKLGDSLFSKKIEKNEDSQPFLYMFSGESDVDINPDEMTREDLVNAYGEERVEAMTEALRKYHEGSETDENSDKALGDDKQIEDNSASNVSSESALYNLPSVASQYSGASVDINEVLGGETENVETAELTHSLMENVFPGTEAELEFGDGEYIKEIDIYPIKNKTSDGDRIFTVVLNGGSDNVTISPNNSATCTIKDDEPDELSEITVNSEETPSEISLDDKTIEIKLKREKGLYQTATHTLTAYTDKNDVLIHGTVIYMPGMETQTVKVDTERLLGSGATKINVALSDGMGCTVPDGVCYEINLSGLDGKSLTAEAADSSSSEGIYYNNSNSPVGGLAGYGTYSGFKADISSDNFKYSTSGGSCDGKKNKLNGDNYLVEIPDHACGCKNSYTTASVGGYNAFNFLCIQSIVFDWKRDDHEPSTCNRMFFSLHNRNINNWNGSDFEIAAMKGDLSRRESTIDLWSGNLSNCGSTESYSSKNIGDADKYSPHSIYLTSKKTSGGINGMTLNVYGMRINYRQYSLEVKEPDKLSGHTELPGLLSIVKRDNSGSGYTDTRYALEKIAFAENSLQKYAQLSGMYIINPSDSNKSTQISSKYFDAKSAKLDMSSDFLREYSSYIDVNNAKIILKPIYEQKNITVTLNTSENGGIEFDGKQYARNSGSHTLTLSAGSTVKIKPYDIADDYAFSHYDGSMSEVNSSSIVRNVPFETSSEEQNLELEYYDYNITPVYSYTGTQITIVTPDGVPDGCETPQNSYMSQKDHGIKAGNILSYTAVPKAGYRAQWIVKTSGHPWNGKVFYGDSFDYELLSGDNTIELRYEDMGGDNYVKYIGKVQSYNGTVLNPPVKDSSGSFTGDASPVAEAMIAFGSFNTRSGSDGVFSLYSREAADENSSANTTHYVRMWPNETHTIKVTCNNITNVYTFNTGDFEIGGGTAEEPQEIHLAKPITADFYGSGPIPSNIQVMEGVDSSTAPTGGERIASVPMANNTVGFRLTLDNLKENTPVTKVAFSIYDSDMALRNTYTVETNPSDPKIYELTSYPVQNDDGTWGEMYLNGLLNFHNGDRLFVDIMGTKSDSAGNEMDFSYGMYDTGVSFFEVPGQDIEVEIPTITVSEEGGIPMCDIIGTLLPAVNAGPLTVKAVITSKLMEFNVGFNVEALNKTLYSQGITGGSTPPEGEGGEQVTPQSELDALNEEMDDLYAGYINGDISQEEYEGQMEFYMNEQNRINSDIEAHANDPVVPDEHGIPIEEPTAEEMANPQAKAETAANPFGKQIKQVNSIIDNIKQANKAGGVANVKDSVLKSMSGVKLSVNLTFGITVRMVPNAEMHTWVFDSAMVYGQVGFGITATFYTTIPEIPIPIYTGFGFTTSVGLYNGMSAMYPTTLDDMDGTWDEPPQLYYKGMVPIAIGLEIFVGVGIKNLLCLELGGGFLQEFNLAWGTGQKGIGKTTFYAYASMGLVIFSAKWRFLQKTWQYELYDTANTANAAAMMNDFTASMDMPLSDMTVDTHDYRAVMHGAEPGTAALAGELVHDKTFTLAEDIADSKPAVASLGDNRYIMVFEGIRQDADTLNRMAAYYSIFDGSSWSMPQPISDDGTNDTNVNVEEVGDKIIITWASAESTLSGSDFEYDENGNLKASGSDKVKDVLNSFDLYSIVLDKNDVTAENIANPENTKRITEDTRTTGSLGYFNGKTKSTALSDGRILTFYTSTDYNSYSDIKIETLADLLALPGVMMYRVYENGEWSEDYPPSINGINNGNDWYGQRLVDINLVTDDGKVYYPVSDSFDVRRIEYGGSERVLISYIADADGDYSSCNDRAVCIAVINPDPENVSISLPLQICRGLSSVANPKFVTSSTDEFGDVTLLTWSDGTDLMYYNINKLFNDYISNSGDDNGTLIKAGLTEGVQAINGKNVPVFILNEGTEQGYAIMSTDDERYQLTNGYDIISGDDGNVYVVWAQSEGDEQKMNICTLTLDKVAEGEYQEIWSKPQTISLKNDGDNSPEYISDPKICVDDSGNMMVAHNRFGMELVTETDENGKELAAAKEKTNNCLCVAYEKTAPSLTLDELTLSEDYPQAGTKFTASVTFGNNGILKTGEVNTSLKLVNSAGETLQSSENAVLDPILVGRHSEFTAAFEMTDEMIENALNGGESYKVIAEARDMSGMETLTAEADVNVGSRLVIDDLNAEGVRSRDYEFGADGKPVFKDENGGNIYVIDFAVRNTGNADAEMTAVNLSMENRMSKEHGGWPGIDADKNEMFEYLYKTPMNASVVNNDNYKPYIGIGGVMLSDETSVAAGAEKRLRMRTKTIEDKWFSENGGLNMYLSIDDKNGGVIAEAADGRKAESDTYKTFGVLRADLMNSGVSLDIMSDGKENTDNDNITIYEGDVLDLSARIQPASIGLDSHTQWSSSDESTAEVSADGTVTAKRAGTAVITASLSDYNDITDTVTVTVKKKSSGTSSGGSSSSGLSTGTTSPSAEPSTEPTSTVSPVQSETPNALPFNDVSESDWFFDDIQWAYNNGIMNGTEPDLFEPYSDITRGMLVTTLGRMSGVEPSGSTSEFTDVDANEYYAPYIGWAAENGIVDGYGDGLFGPNDPITREQAAKIILNYEKTQGKGPVGQWAIRLDYTDLDQISDWAVEGIMYCTMKGIMQGNDDGSFAPQSEMTRAETAAILHRCQTIE